MKLLLNSHRLGEVQASLGHLINRHGLTETAFSSQSADEATGPRCGRCNVLLHHHLWQFVDPDQAEQGGVMDCEVAR